MPLRIGAHPWPGYELLYLARQRGQLDPQQVRLIELPSASASLRALAVRSIEGATLTLDEVLLARSRGIDLTVVAVLDESHGADVVLVQPGLQTAGALRGKRIGVEVSATGALMLDAFLARQGLAPRDVQMVALNIENHQETFLRGQVDALVTYEPVRTQLRQAGAVQVFSSADIPSTIIDTLAIRTAWLASHPAAVGHAVAAHFWALAQWQRHPEHCAPQMAPRLGLSSEAVLASYADMALPDVRANRAWLAPGLGRIHRLARQLVDTMRRADILNVSPDLSEWVSDAFLPGVDEKNG
jgi:NitT/TauT family transport system substrate-binding protein